MNKYIFASPSKYIQGVHVLKETGSLLEKMGTDVLLIADSTVWKIVSNEIEKSFKHKNLKHTYVEFKGEASEQEIERITNIATEKEINIVVGIGGGKTLDTAKAIADNIKAKTVIIPTAASTDAPCSALSVIYGEDGTFEKYRFYEKNPDLVLVDTLVCAKAPVRLFASGIADGLATYVEASSVLKSDSLSMLNGRPTIAGMAVAKACEDTLLTYGLSAYEAVEKGVVTPAVEAVIEANTLLSGLGFENGGLAGAHAIHNGFTAIHGDIHKLTHGEKVAYGTLVHMVLENRPLEEITKYIKFYKKINMPTTLKEVHLDGVSWDNLVKIGEVANSENDTLQNLSKRITPEEVASAILAVDAISQKI